MNTNLDAEFFELLKKDPNAALQKLGIANPTPEMLEDIKKIGAQGIDGAQDLFQKLSEQNVNVAD